MEKKSISLSVIVSILGGQFFFFWLEIFMSEVVLPLAVSSIVLVPLLVLTNTSQNQSLVTVHLVC